MTSLNTNSNTGTNNSNTTTNTTARTTAANVKSTTSSSVQDSKNENTLNELKFYKQENEALKKEVNRLKVSLTKFPYLLMNKHAEDCYYSL